ncbi:MAG: SDR family oxidoreductase [Armatimonadota bacterium]|nr:SDR family oxidoreductase [Armatimonadota bacterium]
MIRESLPHLGERSSIVLVGSTAGQRGEAGHAHYAASKGGLHALALSLAEELAPRTRVNVVAPGWVRTPMTRTALAERGARIVAGIPLRRIAEPEDVAQAVLFLASDASRHITGEILGVSGGALVPMPR